VREGLFLVEGPQAVREAVAHRPDLVREVYYDASAGERHTGLVQSALSKGLRTHEVSADVLAAMSGTNAPQGLLAVCRIPGAGHGADDHAADDLAVVLAARPRLLVVLAHVRDPGNVGTVIRGADAAGADAVLVSDASVDVYNPKVVRSTAGSLFHLPVVTGLPVTDLIDRLAGAGLRLLAADGSGERLLGDTDLTGPHAWIMGNEAWGLDPGVADACDEVVRVPIYGRAESLNLAMAATICLYASAAVQRGSTPSR